MTKTTIILHSESLGRGSDELGENNDRFVSS